MKKSLIALAALMAAGAASAQSSVTLFGILDVGISRYSMSGGDRVTVMSSGAYNSSRLGLRGTEDLGGGMSASFWLEGQLANDEGNGFAQGGGLNFQRRSTVSLAGNWGELRLGRDYNPTFWNLTVFDPFGVLGVGGNVGHKVRSVTEGGPYVRSSNMVQYFLPANLGGFYGQISYAFDEQLSTLNTDEGRYWGGRVGYASGPFNVAASYGKRQGASPARANERPDMRDWNIGGQWDFGMAKLMGVYDNVKYSFLGSDDTLKSFVVGGLIPVGAGEVRLSYGQAKMTTAGDDPKMRQLAFGYVHNLSKRTALYATYARVTNKNGANLRIQGGPAPVGLENHSSSGFDLGIRHSF